MGKEKKFYKKEDMKNTTNKTTNVKKIKVKKSTSARAMNQIRAQNNAR